MLLLIFAYGNVRCAIGKDVGGHQIWINVEPHGRVLAILARLFLDLGHPIEPADASDAVKYPREFGMLGNLALVEDDVFLRVDAAGEECSRHFTRGPREFARILPYGDGMQIDDAIDAVIAILQRHKPGY